MGKKKQGKVDTGLNLGSQEINRIKETGGGRCEE